MFLFLAIIVHMGKTCDRLRDYCTRAEQFFTPLYPNTMTQYYFLHILCYLHFTDGDKEVDKNDNNLTDWKIREIFDTVNDTYSKFYKTFGN